MELETFDRPEALSEVVDFAYPEVAGIGSGAMGNTGGGVGLSESSLLERFADVFPGSRAGFGVSPSGHAGGTRLEQPDSEANAWDQDRNRGRGRAASPAMSTEGSSLNLGGGTEAESGRQGAGVASFAGSFRAEEPPRSGETRVAEARTGEARAAEARAAEDRGRSEGFELGAAAAREQARNQFDEERKRLYLEAASLVESIRRDRESQLHRLEQETARLALAIAARILRREAATDPLLLTGAVRVALGQIAASTSVVLHVPAEDQAMWEQVVALIPGLRHRPKVEGEPQMELGHCRMETELGSADLGLHSQLNEIERGFFDRIEEGSREAAERVTVRQTARQTARMTDRQTDREADRDRGRSFEDRDPAADGEPVSTGGALPEDVSGVSAKPVGAVSDAT